jgi:hypothetical protein
MPGTFGDRMDELQAIVGEGLLIGHVSFDQVYAVNQHEGDWLNFMGRYGPKTMKRGRPHFLSDPLTGGSNEFMSTIADHVLIDGPTPGMVQDVEQLADESAAEAPVEFGDLAGSAHPQVTDDGALVYDRPPMVPRLSEAELDAKSRKTDRVRDYLPKDHPLHGTTHPTTAAKPAPVIGGE